MHITELCRLTGASADEVRYMERKGFITPAREQVGQRTVRLYQETDLQKVRLILKHRRLGFTWDSAFKRAVQELENPLLL